MVIRTTSYRSLGTRPNEQVTGVAGLKGVICKVVLGPEAMLSLNGVLVKKESS